MKRGDLATIALQGAYGKPHPALIIQSDLFNEHPSVTVLPVTSELRDPSVFRLAVTPSKTNGLQKESQIMIDKVQTVPREKVGLSFGRLDKQTLLSVNRALAVFLGFA
ncbi:Transcriptional modulator of MazE/toxin, MazF [Mycoavidus cysteinexigens]|uniref:Transcriptional modulator of MazE/toxin, MazF n=1 Tax=Mycoavidus cysteinexigens TaxID=1553431 RepID=A0A2Z6EWR2_9BURK|nr:type II toxin-antitoxin system PemK/MazF family toxin [Mycoavidus cysteinexigens]BBE09893.1 Transcriptional modulator of MazE/toxin, MazF [Mycoavidus cysteinexigens]GAM53762.1 growth inhibitor [bacterium endosymbiont of Mortierella elongata FMR23-6]GLR00333.1 mRNA interferase PemK [Mycoavidus cysteinexigens]